MRSNAVSDWSASGLGPELDRGSPAATVDGARAEQPGARVARVEQIVARHVDAIWRTARELGVLPRDLDDVVQEVLVVCVRRLSDIEPERERAFLLATTSRVAANWRRTRRRRPADPVDSFDEIAEDPRARGPAEALERKRELELVQSALDEMSEQQREVFTLFELEELTAREIAEQLGLSESVVFARAQRARAVFQRCLSRAEARADLKGRRG
ncbi:MAG TPA: sigma-70 family RNA polymerase sigma factor [Polyangiaceae bacterium]|nr:sigma-70 family RNA polymerase sigma factor [Polyangiaceae bacterium]